MSVEKPDSIVGRPLRVFVSSTAYDLLDVRAEIAELLRALGVSPVMSDDKLSDFKVKHDVNAIDTCLINVDTSDEIIVILDKRYGPKLGAYGFDDVSATHLEYRRAVESRKPIHVFVRDRLEADFAVWKRNKRDPSFELGWVQSDRDRPLFELLEEHRKLSRSSKTTNWVIPFSTSTDLKAGLRKHLEERILPARLMEAIQRNQFPLFDIDVTGEHQLIGRVQSLSFHIAVTNVGGAPAFNFRLFLEDRETEYPTQVAIVAAGTTTKMFFTSAIGRDLTCPNQRLIAEYESPVGIAVRDVFSIGGRIVPGPKPLLISGGSLTERIFRRTPAIALKISD